MSRGTLLAMLREAREPDAALVRDADATAVRVLARVAALEGARALRGRRRPVARALALAAALLLLLARHAGDEPRSPSAAARPARGPAARELLLARAESAADAAPDALRELARLGGPVGFSEARRVAALAADERLRAPALSLLARSRGDSGASALGDALLREPALVGPVVAALSRIAADGRPGLALEALRRGAQAGIPEAAAASVRLGGLEDLGRVLRDAPERAFAGPALAAAVRDAGAAVRASLVRRAARGEARALRLAAVAGLGDLPAALVAHVRDARLAGPAVAAIAAVGGPAAWRVLPLALGGPADAEARDAIRWLPAGAAAVFVDGAMRQGGAGAEAYLDALAELGDAGLGAIVALGARPSLAPRAVAALERSRASGASDALRSMGVRAALALDAVRALAARLDAGDASAAGALLALARTGPARAALDALAASGEAGAPSLREALTDLRLKRLALGALRRAGRRPFPAPSQGDPCDLSRACP